MSSEIIEPVITFGDLDLIEPLQQALRNVGYEKPSPIQLQAIPHLLAGKDLLGVAQTGTGKTAAFALPLLSRIDLSKKKPQILVLAPTRELAIQVAEAFKTYAREMKGFQVLPIYGGQEYGTQLRQLDRGVHVVVGTPGRMMDHIRRGSLMLDSLQALVLDEADEMLRMGFIDDVEWILQQTPDNHQTALFSATMPAPIRSISQKYLKSPVEITIKQKTTTAATITQRYWQVGGHDKLDTLTRVLESEEFDGVIIFVRTKNATLEVAEKLQARGFAAEALNGDIAQNQREKTVTQLKNGMIDILVATDVAARGLDVERISHVINYDIPYDTESYVHRIGRTGRAGREGQAILFVTNREKNMLSSIEHATKQKIEKYQFPSMDVLNQRKIEQLFEKIDAERKKNLSEYIQILERYQTENDIPAIEIAAAFASISQGSKTFLIKDMPKSPVERKEHSYESKDRSKDRDRNRERPVERGDRNDRGDRNKDRGNDRSERSERAPSRERFDRDSIPMTKYKLGIGTSHGIQKGDIVGAIANEGGIDSKVMGRITLNEDHSYIELPEGMPKEVFKALQNVRVRGEALNITVADGTRPTTSPRPASPRTEKSSEPKSFVKRTDSRNDSRGDSRPAAKTGKPKERTAKTAEAPKPRRKAKKPE
jgi:ATP-dependent RNA helicase DeaD